MTSGQLGAWLFTAMSAPLAQMAGEILWPIVLLAGVVSLAAAWYVSRIELEPGKVLCAAQYIWILCVLGAMVRWVGESWPSGDVYPAVPLVLLALAAASACRGEGPASRAGSALFWMTALIYTVVIAAGVGEVGTTDLVPVNGAGIWHLVTVFLLPATAVLVPGMRKRIPVIWSVSIVGFGTVMSALIAGALSPAVAQSVASPLYQWVRGLGLLGTLERFEAIVAVALTMGWFSALSYLMCVAGGLAERSKRGCYRSGVWGSAALTIAGMFVNRWISVGALAIGCAVMWNIVPLISKIPMKRIYKKSKNNT